MPFINRHASPFAPPRPRRTTRHPVLIATTAAAAGVVLGGFVAVQVLGTPVKRNGSASPAHAALNTKPAPPAPHIAETTGSGASAEAAMNCDQQTWPNLTPDCIKDRRTASVPAAADKPVVATAPRPAPPPPIASTAVADQTTSAVQPQAAQPRVVQPQASSPPSAADKPEPVKAVAATSAPHHVEAKVEPKVESKVEPKAKVKTKHVAKKIKHKSRRPTRKQFDDEDEGAVARNDYDDRDTWRSDRRPAFVSRWRERAYDAADEDRGERRIVIRRDDGGGPFGGIFGGFDGD